MRDKRSLLHFAVLITVAAATAVFVLQRAQEAIAEINALSEYPAWYGRGEIVAGIDTSNWNTYRNEQYGFEVRYPKEWDDNTRYDGLDTFQLSAGGRTYVFFVARRDSQQLNFLDNPECFEKIRSVNISGITWIVNREVCTAGGPDTEISASVIWENNIFRILLATPSKQEKAIADLEEILSTFKFKFVR